MKRKITELEQKLLDKGFVLESKSYWGKHSQRVHYYLYLGQVNVDNGFIVTTQVVLNAKKNKIEEVNVDNVVAHDRFVYVETLKIYADLAVKVRDEILGLENE